METAQIANGLMIVNHGSLDRILQICSEINRELPIKVPDLSTNSGCMAGITAGFKAEKVDFAASIDAELQDPPAELLSTYNILFKSTITRT